MSTILPDFLTRVRPTVDLTIQPVAPTKDVQEALSRLVSGQRVFAEILTALPNGTYRAVVSQREMVLALPFSAKTGDTLEMQVLHTDGKVAFAVMASRGDAAATPAATTTLSPAGQLISQLLGQRTAAQTGTPSSAALAAGKPLLAAPPTTSQTLAPVLQQAIADSGVFYEAHQARWIDGRYPLAALMREPQHLLAGSRPGTAGVLPDTSARPPVGAPPGPGLSGATIGTAGAANTANATAASAATRHEAAAGSAALDMRAGNALGLPKEVLPLVQQQLQSLEAGTYLWHGQVWPGQTMDWAITDEQSRQREQQAGDDGVWKTRLRLHFPALGAVAAEIRLRGQNIEVQIASGDARPVLEAGLDGLRTQFEAAGLRLTGVTFADHDADA